MSNYGRGRSNTPKVHFGVSFSDTACGTSPASRDYVTTDKQRVDCKRCQAKMVKLMAAALSAGMRR